MRDKKEGGPEMKYIQSLPCRGISCKSHDGQKCIFFKNESCKNLDIACYGIIWIHKKPNGGLPMKSVKQVQNAIFAKETKIEKLTGTLKCEKDSLKALKAELKEAKKKK
jgi:hypothetical protein